jgi:hypothetical protein
MKNTKIILNIFIIIVIILLLLCFLDNLSVVHLCDSGSINDINDNTNNDNNNSDYVTSLNTNLTQLPITDRIRRRISWYTTGKFGGRHDTYNEFKTSWDPDTKIWKDIKLAIKNDFKKLRLNAEQARRQSKIDNNQLMSDIRRTRELSNKNRIKRYNKMFNPSTKK